MQRSNMNLNKKYSIHLFSLIYRPILPIEKERTNRRTKSIHCQNEGDVYNCLHGFNSDFIAMSIHSIWFNFNGIVENVCQFWMISFGECSRTKKIISQNEGAHRKADFSFSFFPHHIQSMIQMILEIRSANSMQLHMVLHFILECSMWNNSTWYKRSGAHPPSLIFLLDNSEFLLAFCVIMIYKICIAIHWIPQIWRFQLCQSLS